MSKRIDGFEQWWKSSQGTWTDAEDAAYDAYMAGWDAAVATNASQPQKLQPNGKRDLDGLRDCSTCKRSLPIKCFGFYRSENRYKSSCKECLRVKFRAKRASGKYRDTRKRSGKSDPLKIRAKNLLKNAVTKGLVERKPCEVCGSTSSEGHHSDYSKPLEVRWLCRKHHCEVHRTPVAPEALAAFGGSK